MKYILTDGIWHAAPVAYIMGIPEGAKAIAYNGDNLVDGKVVEYCEVYIGSNKETISPCPWTNTRIRVRSFAETWEIQLAPHQNFLYPGTPA